MCCCASGRCYFDGLSDCYWLMLLQLVSCAIFRLNGEIVYWLLEDILSETYDTNIK